MADKPTIIADEKLKWAIFTAELVPYFIGDDAPVDDTDAREVRAEIERRGLVGMFLIELTTAIDPGVTVGPYDRQWAFFNASPEAQCRAALKAVGGANA